MRSIHEVMNINFNNDEIVNSSDLMDSLVVHALTAESLLD